jgi:hypothetical protein
MSVLVSVEGHYSVVKYTDVLLSDIACICQLLLYLLPPQFELFVYFLHITLTHLVQVVVTELILDLNDFFPNAFVQVLKRRERFVAILQ